MHRDAGAEHDGDDHATQQQHERREHAHQPERARRLIVPLPHPSTVTGRTADQMIRIVRIRGESVD